MHDRRKWMQRLFLCSISVWQTCSRKTLTRLMRRSLMCSSAYFANTSYICKEWCCPSNQLLRVFMIFCLFLFWPHYTMLSHMDCSFSCSEQFLLHFFSWPQEDGLKFDHKLQCLKAAVLKHESSTFDISYWKKTVMLFLQAKFRIIFTVSKTICSRLFCCLSAGKIYNQNFFAQKLDFSDPPARKPETV